MNKQARSASKGEARSFPARQVGNDVFKIRGLEGFRG